jgi:hypothetical protein
MEDSNPKIITNKEQYLDIFKGKLRVDALKTALDTRKFEIELYWKRATYFWAFIAATFAAFFILLTSKNNEQFKGFTIVISSIGFFFSLGWYFVNRGSKIWQENWEKHVYFLEQGIQGPLFAYVNIPEDNFMKLTGGYPFSVSKINQLLSLMMSLFWFGAFIFSILYSFNKLPHITNVSYPMFCVIAISLTILIIALSVVFARCSFSFLKKEKNLMNDKDKSEGIFVTKDIINKEKSMESNITMGNDEFILYIRKQTKTCAITNDQLGKMIWIWLRDRGAKKTKEDKLSLWGKYVDNTNEIGIPKTATQFEFDRALLPELYNYLDELSKL